MLEVTMHSETDSTRDLETMDSETQIQRHMSLIKWFMLQIENLPKYTSEEVKPWALFEIELRTAWGKTSLDRFLLALQKQAIIRHVEGEASRIHALISEGSWV